MNKSFLLRMPEELHEAIRKFAHEKELPMREVMVRILSGVILREREK